MTRYFFDSKAVQSRQQDGTNTVDKQLQLTLPVQENNLWDTASFKKMVSDVVRHMSNVQVFGTLVMLLDEARFLQLRSLLLASRNGNWLKCIWVDVGSSGVILVIGWISLCHHANTLVSRFAEFKNLVERRWHDPRWHKSLSWPTNSLHQQPSFHSQMGLGACGRLADSCIHGIHYLPHLQKLRVLAWLQLFGTDRYLRTPIPPSDTCKRTSWSQSLLSISWLHFKFRMVCTRVPLPHLQSLSLGPGCFLDPCVTGAYLNRF